MRSRPVIWVAVALAAGVILTVSVRSSKDKFIGEQAEKARALARSGEPVEQEESSCCGAGAEVVVRPALERRGNPQARVQVVGFVPDSAKHNDVVEIVRQLVASHPDAVNIMLYSSTTVAAEEEMEELGHDGPGFFVNGRNEFTVQDEDGSTREVVFADDPTKDYDPRDLKAVIEQAIADLAGSDSGVHTAASTGGEAGVDVVAHGEVR